jgi:hypothetical protein
MLVFGYQGHPSPLEKYDLYVSGLYPGAATDWEEDNRYDPDAESWAGYCHAWVNASILEEIDFITSAHQGIFFDIGDKKGLITLCHAGDQQINAYCSQDASVFHRYLLKYIGDNGVAIAADLSSSTEFWSYPIYEYDMELVPAVIYDQGQFIRVDDVICTIYYADDFVNPDYEGTRTLTETYYYRLYKDDSGSYTHGEWTGESVGNHPESVWIPVSQSADNPYLDYDVIRNIAVLQDDENEGQAKLSPGHHAVIIYPDEDDFFTFDVPTQGTVDLAFALDSQSPRNSSAACELTADGQVIFSGELSDVIQSLSFTRPDPCTYELSIWPGAMNESSVFVHLYLDITMAENLYLLNVPSNYGWLGMALANQNSQANRFYLTFLTEQGLPAGSAQIQEYLDKDAKWSGLVDVNLLPFDYFSSGIPSLIRVTSEYPLGLLEIFGDEDTLYGPPVPRYKDSPHATEWVVPELTGILEVERSARLFFYNPDSEEITCEIDYFTDDGIDSGNQTWTVAANHFQEFVSGGYPEHVNLAGWALVNDPSGQLMGKVEVIEVPEKKDDLPLLDVGTAFYLPHIASGYGWDTRLTLFNAAGHETDVMISCVRGEEENEITVSLEAHEKKELVLDPFLLEISEGYICDSWLHISAVSPIAGFMSYRYSDKSLVSFPLFTDQDVSSKKSLCHVASNKTWFTGIVILNPNEHSAEIDIAGLDSAGNQIATTVRSVDGRSKLVTSIEDLFPEIRDPVERLMIEASTPVMGFAIYAARADAGLLSGIVLE